MSHINQLLPRNLEELKEIADEDTAILTVANSFKIGDQVYFFNDQTDEIWTIIKFAWNSQDKLVAILRNDTFDTWSLLSEIKLVC